MRFSILIPVYNVEKYLKACVQSVINQSFQDFEIILIDDGSKDSSGMICDSYKQEKRITVIHKENEGLISARRCGLKAAKGEYIVFCDSDDLLECNALEQLNSVILNEKADIVLYNMSIYKNQKKPFFEHLFKNGEIIDKRKILNELFLNYKYNSLCSKTCKRELFDIDRDYHKFYRNNFGEDLLQSVPLYLNAEKIVYLDESLYVYRYSSGMMRKFNKNYFYSYSAVADNVEKQLLTFNVENLKEKKAAYILNAAYGHIMQYKYSRSLDKEEVEKLISSDIFQNSYTILVENHSGYLNSLSKKQLSVLKLAKQKNYLLLHFSIVAASLIAVTGK